MRDRLVVHALRAGYPHVGMRAGVPSQGAGAAFRAVSHDRLGVRAPSRWLPRLRSSGRPRAAFLRRLEHREYRRLLHGRASTRAGYPHVGMKPRAIPTTAQCAVSSQGARAAFRGVSHDMLSVRAGCPHVGMSPPIPATAQCSDARVAFRDVSHDTFGVSALPAGCHVSGRRPAHAPLPSTSRTP